MALATFASVWILGKLVEFGIIQFIISITSSYKAQKSSLLPHILQRISFFIQ